MHCSMEQAVLKAYEHTTTRRMTVCMRLDCRNITSVWLSQQKFYLLKFLILLRNFVILRLSYCNIILHQQIFTSDHLFISQIWQLATLIWQNLQTACQFIRFLWEDIMEETMA